MEDVRRPDCYSVNSGAMPGNRVNPSLYQTPLLGPCPDLLTVQEPSAHCGSPQVGRGCSLQFISPLYIRPARKGVGGESLYY